MAENKNVISVKQQEEIQKIAQTAINDNPELDYATCYSITLLYYLTQFFKYKTALLPPLLKDAVELLYKNPISSYIHYRTTIMYSNNIYAKAIKNAEIQVMGDDPRCPW